MIRPYQPADLDALYDICVRTADDGGDGRGQFSDDRLIGDLYAAPYATFEPEHVHLLDDGAGNVGGYILGTADTARYVGRYRDEWLPVVAKRYAGAPDRELLDRPLQPLAPELAGYPAHLHVDLLPEWQGRGFGRGLMSAFLGGLRNAGVKRVHLGVSSTNTGARAFYERLGFTRIPIASKPNALYLGRETG